jgi:hypothetical protein
MLGFGYWRPVHSKEGRPRRSECPLCGCHYRSRIQCAHTRFPLRYLSVLRVSPCIFFCTGIGTEQHGMMRDRPGLIRSVGGK